MVTVGLAVEYLGGGVGWASVKLKTENGRRGRRAEHNTARWGVPGAWSTTAGSRELSTQCRRPVVLSRYRSHTTHSAGAAKQSPASFGAAALLPIEYSPVVAA
jgi:hypothetical protein